MFVSVLRSIQGCGVWLDVDAAFGDDRVVRARCEGGVELGGGMVGEDCGPGCVMFRLGQCAAHIGRVVLLGRGWVSSRDASHLVDCLSKRAERVVGAGLDGAGWQAEVIGGLGN